MSGTRDLENEAERLVRPAATDRLPVDAGVIRSVTALIREARDRGQEELRDLAKAELRELASKRRRATIEAEMDAPVPQRRNR